MKIHEKTTEIIRKNEAKTSKKNIRNSSENCSKKHRFLHKFYNNPKMADIDSDRARSVGIDMRGFRAKPNNDRISMRKRSKNIAEIHGKIHKKSNRNYKKNRSKKQQGKHQKFIRKL